VVGRGPEGTAKSDSHSSGGSEFNDEWPHGPMEKEDCHLTDAVSQLIRILADMVEEALRQGESSTWRVSLPTGNPDTDLGES